MPIQATRKELNLGRTADGSALGHSVRRVGHRRRRGHAFEVIFVVPLLLILTLASLEIGFVMIAEQTVTAAAAAGAREAAQVGATTATVASVVEEYLAAQGITLTSTGDTLVIVNDGTLPSSVAGQAGNTTIIPKTISGSLLTNQVRVTVCVRAADPTNRNRPVPNWLSDIAFSMTGRTIQVSALSYRE